jgi:hypothetical protein
MATCRYNCKKGKVFLEGLGGLVDCPDCRNILKVLEEPQGDGTSFYDKLRIPPAYRSFGVAGHELFNLQGLGAFSPNSIHDVGNLFERINKDVYAGKVTNVSSYIYTSNIVDSKRFVYGAQKLALEKGMGVTPFISANTLYGLQKVGDYNLRSLQEVNAKQGELKDIPPDLIHAVDGYRLVQTTDLTYFDFIHADLCFIEATANTTEKGWTGIADLLGERSKQGLPTYVLGYWGTKGGGWTGSKGLKYLLAPEQGAVRLDLLVPYELKGKTGTGDEAQVTRIMNMDSGRSDVSAGLSIDSLMRG